MTLEQVTRKAVLESLARHRGNKSRAAAELQIALKTVYNLLRRWVDEGHVTQDWLNSLAGMNEPVATPVAPTSPTATTEGTRDDDGNDGTGDR